MTGFAGQFFDFASNRWPDEEGHFLQSLFRFRCPVHLFAGLGGGGWGAMAELRQIRRFRDPCSRTLAGRPWSTNLACLRFASGQADNEQRIGRWRIGDSNP